MFKYSSKFRALTSNPASLQHLLEGSCYHSAQLSRWEMEREYIARAIHHSGTILDVGCGNGFLLRCLQEWSDHELLPYGIDVDPHYLDEARKLFPQRRHCFIHKSLESFTFEDDPMFPKSFDFIYIGIWLNWNCSLPTEQSSLKNLLSRTAEDGRLVLGFYGSESTESERKIRRLMDAGLQIGGTVRQLDGNAFAVWVDHPGQSSRSSG